MRIAMLVVVLAIGASACTRPPGLWRQIPDGRTRRAVPARVRVCLPGKVLVYARPSPDQKAGVSDVQLHKALRQAGHAVSIIEDWTLLV